LGWTGLRLDMGSASVSAIAAGVGADYAIYFLFRLREEHQRLGDDAQAVGVAFQTSGRAILFVASSIAAGFACMGWSPYLGMQLFGTLMPAAMLASCLAAPSLMPVLVLRFRPRFIFGEDVAPAPALGGAARGTGPCLPPWSPTRLRGGGDPHGTTMARGPRVRRCVRRPAGAGRRDLHVALPAEDHRAGGLRLRLDARHRRCGRRRRQAGHDRSEAGL